jgi:cytochrome P450
LRQQHTGIVSGLIIWDKKNCQVLSRYEFYWDVWLRGQYTFHIIELHKKYGPIIRINPFEVHIADPAFIDEVYTGTSRKRDRSEWFTRQFGPSPCILSTQSHDLHRLRRSVLSPFFSKTNVRKLSHVIENKTEQLMDRLSEAKEAGAVLHMNAVYAAVANGRLFSKKQ